MSGMTDTVFKHQKYAVGFEVSTDQLRASAEKLGLTLEQYLEKLARSVPGTEITSSVK